MTELQFPKCPRCGSDWIDQDWVKSMQEAIKMPSIIDLKCNCGMLWRNSHSLLFTANNDNLMWCLLPSHTCVYYNSEKLDKEDNSFINLPWFPFDVPMEKIKNLLIFS